jgi:hypothetical protein
MWLTAGDWDFQAFANRDQHGKRVVGSAIQPAIESYDRAVKLYSNSALCHAKLAEAYLAAGDRAAFRREAETALRLHEITPHEDKKLGGKLHDRLLRELKSAAP